MVVFLLSALYSFPTNSISAKSLNKLDSQTIRMFLPKMGLNQNTAKAIMHGPSKYGGINLRNLAEEQGLSR